MHEHICDSFDGTWPEDEQWIIGQLEIARAYVVSVLGEPPEPMSLDIAYLETDYGDVPYLGLWNGFYDSGEYRSRCEELTGVLRASVDWERLRRRGTGASSP